VKVVRAAEEGLGRGHVWGVDLRRFENHLLIGVCLSQFQHQGVRRKQ